MRLIDADRLLEELIAYRERTNQTSVYWAIDDAVDIVKEQPTAYDVDSVIEELETNEEFYRDMDDDFYYEGMQHAFTDAIEIVRRGGLND